MFDWLSSHWKTVATVAVAAVVFTAVTVATGGLGAPVAAALLAGGFASGAAGYATSELLDGRTPTVQGTLVQGTVAAGLTVATFGVGRVLAPVVAPVVASVLPEAVTSAVPAVVGRTVTNSAVGATFGTGIQVAQNAATNRPLLENTQDAAIFGAVSGALVEPTVRVVSAVAPGPRVTTATVAPPPIDPVTQTTMTRYGMTPDTILYRVTEPRWVQDGQISGNPNSMAIVADPYNMVDHPWAAGNPGLDLPKLPRQVNAKSLGPSLNVALKDPGIYGDPGMVKVGIRLGDVLAAGGKIYPDTGAMAQGLKPLIVTFDGSVPVASVEPLGAAATTNGTTTSDTTAQPLPAAPSRTRGFTAALGQD